MSKLTGGCLCGRIEYEVSPAPGFVYQCFCGKCRAASGASFVTNLIAESATFHITKGKDDLTAFESSPGKFRHFCSTCGSPIYSQGEKTKHVVSVRCGTLRDDPGLRNAYHAFVASKAPWVEIRDELPQFDEWPDPELVKRLFARSKRE
jgi:hypothetical protein